MSSGSKTATDQKQSQSALRDSSSELSSATENDADSDENEFQDAEGESGNVRSFQMDLDGALEEAMLALSYFFNNQFDEARSLPMPQAESSMYHSMGGAMFSFLEAILTFDKQCIAKAGEEIKKCLDVCQRYRRKSTFTESIGNKFKAPSYSQYTDLESHAELCTAEALLLRALLTFIKDETLTSLIRGGIKVRNCFSSYKECAQILKKREWQSETSKMHFESGVRLGMGTFNLWLSLLPAGIIKLLEFIGFSGDKESGYEDLKAGYKLPGLRQVLSGVALLSYNLIVCYVLRHQDGDLELCNEILDELLQKYPNGVWFLYFKGRLEFMRGNLDEAQYWYKKSWKSQSMWERFHVLCFWELLWVNCLKLDWRECSLYADYLLENSKWSRSIHSYQKAASMLMLNDLTASEQETIDNLMKDIPKFKQRLAGKSLPMEKFSAKKAERYFAQNRTLCLPALELMYICNTFKVLGKQYSIADSIYQVIDRQLQALLAKKTSDPYYVNNRVLCLLLRGACLRQMERPFLALQDIEMALSLQASVKEDIYLIAYASVEAALIHADENRIDVAIAMLEDTKKKYAGYSMESRLNFRIHAALMELKPKQK